MFWWNKDEEKLSTETVYRKSNSIEKIELPISIEEKYIWVEGYKGTNKDMVCEGTYYDYVYRDGYGRMPVTKLFRQVYELNQRFDLGGEPKTCERGFHFCLNLEDVFRYYEFDFQNRFFKVKAYVKESDYEKVKNSNDSKIAAKSIILTEEICIDYEMVSGTKAMRYDSCNTNYVYKISKDEFEDIMVKHKYKTVEEMANEKFKERMIEYGYSETFAFILAKKFKTDICYLMWTLEKAKAFAEEKVSKDMAVYLLLEKEQ